MLRSSTGYGWAPSVGLADSVEEWLALRVARAGGQVWRVCAVTLHLAERVGFEPTKSLHP